jgi:hypothetical protein
MAQSGERRARQQKAGRQIDPQKISTKPVTSYAQRFSGVVKRSNVRHGNQKIAVRAYMLLLAEKELELMKKRAARRKEAQQNTQHSQEYQHYLDRIKSSNK